MNKKEEKKEEYFNPHPFSFIPPPYKLTGSLIPLAHAFVLQSYQITSS